MGTTLKLKKIKIKFSELAKTSVLQNSTGGGVVCYWTEYPTTEAYFANAGHLLIFRSTPDGDKLINCHFVPDRPVS